MISMTMTSTVFGGETMINRALENPAPNHVRELTENEIDATSGGVLPLLLGILTGAMAVGVGIYIADSLYGRASQAYIERIAAERLGW
jgi:hypothetical protein